MTNHRAEFIWRLYFGAHLQRGEPATYALDDPGSRRSDYGQQAAADCAVCKPENSNAYTAALAILNVSAHASHS
jgi:hypothetical protein